MYIIGLDVETTGLDAEDEIVEMGAVLYCTITKRNIASFGKIYKVEKWSDEAQECHKIDRSISNLMEFAKDSIDPWDLLSGDLAKYVVAHNAAHDYKFVTKVWPSFKKKPWLCTVEDLPHRQVIHATSKRLAHLCADYQIMFTNWHQALADAEACAKIAGLHDLDEAYNFKMTPKYKLICRGDFIKDIKNHLADCPSTVFDGRKYVWDSENKYWHRDGLLKTQLVDDIKHIKNVARNWDFDVEPMPDKEY